MAISSNEKLSDSNAPMSSCSKVSNLSSCRLMKIDYSADESATSGNKNDRPKKTKASPYLTGERVHMLSRVTEKRFVRKKTTDFVSSFPLAVSIYKANSDEFKSLKKGRKKSKKSVLTLPNNPAPLPQACTVSDMNDSEYFNEKKDERKAKTKKRRAILNNRKSRLKNKDIEIYDRDARYCSQFNIDLDSSSTELINQFPGDGRKSLKKLCQNELDLDKSFEAHDVWALLRNINQLQFKPSPPASQESIISPKKYNNNNKQRNNRRNTGFMETTRTEEFAYISSFVDNSGQNSRSQSSIDRITVIDKHDNFDVICNNFEECINKLDNPCKMKVLNKGINAKKYKSKCSKQINVKEINNKENQRNVSPENIKSNENISEGKELNIIPIENKNNVLASKINNIEKNDEKKRRMIVNNNDKNCNFKDNYVCDERFNFSDNSGSVRAELSNNRFTLKDKNKDKFNRNETAEPINGITKVVLSKGQNILLTKKLELPKRKPRLATTIPSRAIMSKLTQADIKRRISNIKFPLVILGKDEVSAVSITYYDPPQFSGLEEHIWPFMQEWYSKNDNKKKNNFSEKNVQKIELSRHLEPMRPVKMNNITNNNITLYNKRIIHNEQTSLKDRKMENVHPEEIQQSEIATTRKPMRQFKDKMLHFLYKKSGISGREQQEKTLPYVRNHYKLVDASTNTQIIYLPSRENGIYSKISRRKSLTKKSQPLLEMENTTLENNWPNEFNYKTMEYEILNKYKLPRRQSSNNKYKYSFEPKNPPIKKKWTSDFIENVIKKIKSGIYYNQDEKYHQKFLDIQDQWTQTDKYLYRNREGQSFQEDKAVNFQKNENMETVNAIPGFDDKLPELQIETLTNNKIAVKHCVTNIIVQFDVAVPNEITTISAQTRVQLKQSFNCIPVSVTESQAKVFKSKTTIINATLPAELCSILPKMMRKIIDSNSKLGMPKLAIDKVQSNLFTIKELARYESPDIINQNIVPMDLCSSSKMKSLRDGRFAKRIVVDLPKNNLLDNCFNDINDLLPTVQRALLFNIHVKPKDLLVCNYNGYLRSGAIPNKECQSINKAPSCTALEPYMYSNKRIVPAYERFNFTSLVERLICKTTLGFLIIAVNVFDFAFSWQGNCHAISVISQYNINNKAITSDIKIHSLFDGFKNRFKDQDEAAIKIHDKTGSDSMENSYKNIHITKSEKCKSGAEFCVNNKNKRRGFGKLYKKCKSMSNISGDKICTALAKIISLDDFFSALGSGKMLSSVLDGNIERKILSSINEMKNWMNNITPRQALLVLLLANKKDTSNLVRYRPVILQGIAFNRITRASELDMEIEVIEKENLNKLTQFEGISYLPASVESHDSLLEELYWIAKTTASDYQKPFNESSERLLKSLLEKRKKLNPSYLRVMARYVGLGLLKPTK